MTKVLYYVQRRLNISRSVPNYLHTICGERSAEYGKYLFINAVIKWNIHLCVLFVHLTTFWFISQMIEIIQFNLLS
jgi:hypothetical protein